MTLTPEESFLRRTILHNLECAMQGIDELSSTKPESVSFVEIESLNQIYEALKGQTVWIELTPKIEDRYVR